MDHTRKQTEQNCTNISSIQQSFGGQRKGNCSLHELHQAEIPQTPFYASRHLQKPFPAPPSCPKAVIIHRFSCLFHPQHQNCQGCTESQCNSEPPSNIRRLRGKPAGLRQPKRAQSCAKISATPPKCRQWSRAALPEHRAHSPACTGIVRNTNTPSTPNATCDPDSAPLAPGSPCAGHGRCSTDTKGVTLPAC